MEASAEKLTTCELTKITRNNELVGFAWIFTGTANGAVRLASDGTNIRGESWRTARARAPSYIRIGVATSVLIQKFDICTGHHKR